jgi:uncharacterized protein (TIGR03435 family)
MFPDLIPGIANRVRKELSSFALATFTVAGITLVAAAQSERNFEVVSIRPDHTGSAVTGRTSHTPGERFTASNISAKQLTGIAFNVRPDEISGGPAWFSQDHYDITAKGSGPGTLTLAELRPMVRSLLIDRFHLKFHTEPKVVSAYGLIIGKNGPKLQKPADSPTAASVTVSGNGVTLSTITGTDATTDSLAKTLQMQLNQRVFDRTGLSGEYDFKINYSPSDSTDSPTPSIFTAIQELGLRLEAEKDSVDAVVVESINKPSAN